MATRSILPARERAIDREPSDALRRFPLLRLAHLWHLTSLDAPTVAVVWCLAFAWAARVQLPLWILLILALAAWAFYIADRLLDARKILRIPRGNSLSRNLPGSQGDRRPGFSELRPRHHFHWRNRRIFVPVALAASTLALILTGRYMPWAARARDSALTCGALAYFTAVHIPWQTAARRIRLPKELLVGILFTLACAAPAFTSIPAHRQQMLPILLCFIALAWLNCHAIESWESPRQFRRLSRPSVAQCALGLAASAFLAALGAASLNYPRPAALFAAAAASAAGITLLDRSRHRIGTTTLRTAVDLVLLSPLALLVFP